MSPELPKVVFVSLLSMSHYTSLDKLCHAIWCEIYIVREGYIPYLKKWSKIQKSTEDKLVDQDSQEEDMHGDIQRQILTNAGDTRQP